MTHPSAFSITLPADVAPADQEALRLAITPYAQVQEAESKDVLGLITTLVVVMGSLGTVVGAVNGTIALAEKLNAWRRKRAAAGARTYGALSCPGQEPLDFDPSRTSDPELLAWLEQR